MDSILGFACFAIFLYGCFMLIQKLRGKVFFTKDKEFIEKIKEDAYTQADNTVREANKVKERIEFQIQEKQKEFHQLELDINALEKKIIVKMSGLADNELLDGITSEECKNKLVILKQKEKALIDEGSALIITSVDTKKILNNNIKQIIRCFTVECDNHLCNISVKNIDTVRIRIQRSFDTLNKIFETDGIKISSNLLEIKLEEAIMVFKYEEKKEQEREQQRAIKEQMIEEDKVRREIEREKQKIEKEEKQFSGEIAKLMSYMQKATDSIQSQLYVDKIKELEEKLRLLAIDKENVLQREQNTRAGFVYIISNIGSFGEDIYKIGMTRRLEPMDRVKELSSASVPFEFDVHAMIFSEDAPSLETILHKTFHEYQVNKINDRKEFFKVPLNKIAECVKENHNTTVEFTMLAKAKEYREGLKIKQV